MAEGVVRKKGKKKNIPGRNNSPSVFKYWNTGKLRENKIKRLVRCNQMTRREAEVFWDNLKQIKVSLKPKPRR